MASSAEGARKIDALLNAALSHMVPDGVTLDRLVVGLFKAVDAEASSASRSAYTRWFREAPLAPGWGSLRVLTERVGDWERWQIARRCGEPECEQGGTHTVVSWEAGVASDSAFDSAGGGLD